MTTARSLERPPWEEVYMAFAHELSKRSTCIRTKTGAVLVRNGQILSLGYTGVGSGLQHCEHYWQDQHQREWSNFVESGGYEHKKKKKAVEKAEKKASKIPVSSKTTLASRARSASFDINEEKMRALQLEIAVLKKRNDKPEKQEKPERAERVEKSSSKNYLTGAKGPKSSFRKFIMSDKFVEAHKAWSHENEIHAEVNCLIGAVNQAAGGILFTTTSPCIECAILIHGAKIYKVYYDELKDKKGVEYLAKNGVQCININALVHEPVEFDLSSSDESESTV